MSQVCLLLNERAESHTKRTCLSVKEGASSAQESIGPYLWARGWGGCPGTPLCRTVWGLQSGLEKSQLLQSQMGRFWNSLEVNLALRPDASRGLT